LLSGHEAIDHLKHQGTYSSLQEAMAAARYEAQWQESPQLQGLGSAFELKNAANNLLGYVTGDGFHVTALANGDSKPWQLGLRLEAIGYGANLSPVTSGTIKANANRVQIDRGSISSTLHSAVNEWFLNTSRGIEHGFDIASAPIDKKAGDTLRLRLA